MEGTDHRVCALSIAVCHIARGLEQGSQRAIRMLQCHLHTGKPAWPKVLGREGGQGACDGKGPAMGMAQPYSAGIEVLMHREHLQTPGLALGRLPQRLELTCLCQHSVTGGEAAQHLKAPGTCINHGDICTKLWGSTEGEGTEGRH